MTFLRSESFLLYFIGAAYGAWVMGMIVRGSGGFASDIVLGVLAGGGLWLGFPPALVQFAYPAVAITLASIAAGALIVWIVGLVRPYTILDLAVTERKPKADREAVRRR